MLLNGLKDSELMDAFVQSITLLHLCANYLYGDISIWIFTRAFCNSSCGLGKLTLKLSRYGSGYFFGCDSYPDCRFIFYAGDYVEILQ